MRGGGIHVTSSTIAVYQPWTLQFIENRAENGSGLYLEVNPKLYILKHQYRFQALNNYYSEITMPIMEEPYIWQTIPTLVLAYLTMNVLSKHLH